MNKLQKGVNFGPILIDNHQIFYLTSYSFAFTNIQPFTPGHVLISPLKPYKKMTHMEKEDLEIFFKDTQVVRNIIGTYYKKEILMVVQDGPDSGQTIPHVHCHVMPQGNFSRIEELGNSFRTMEDMALEAMELRRHALKNMGIETNSSLNV